MKLLAVPKKNAVQGVVAFIVIGALLGHDYPRTGWGVALCSVGFYLLLVGRRTIGYLFNFGAVDGERKTLAATGLCIAGLFVHGAATGAMSNFPLVLLLAVDYFIYDRHERTSRK